MENENLTVEQVEQKNFYMIFIFLYKDQNMTDSKVDYLITSLNQSSDRPGLEDSAKIFQRIIKGIAELKGFVSYEFLLGEVIDGDKKVNEIISAYRKLWFLDDFESGHY